MKIAKIFSIALVISCSHVAQATIKVASFSGTVSFGEDGSGFFGTGGSNLAGNTMVIRFGYDTSLGTRQTAPNFFDLVANNVSTGANPVRFVDVRINGRSLRSNPNATSAAQTNFFHKSVNYISTEDRNDGSIRTFFGTGLTFANQFAPRFLEDDVAPVTLSGLVANTHGFLFQRSQLSNNQSVQLISGYFGSSLKYSVSNGSTVPEPASWLLLVGGFGLIGGALRRQRRAVAA